jgi:hypothetical protein
MIDGLHIQNRTMKPFEIALIVAGGFEGERWGDPPMYNVSPFGTVTMNLPCTTNISL